MVTFGTDVFLGEQLFYGGDPVASTISGAGLIASGVQLGDYFGDFIFGTGMGNGRSGLGGGIGGGVASYYSVAIGV